MYKVQYLSKDNQWHDLIGYPATTWETAVNRWEAFMLDFKNMDYRIVPSPMLPKF